MVKVRKVKVNNSEKIICKYFDNGYCRFLEECKFHHLEDVCELKKCENEACMKRHSKPCSFYKRRRYRFGQACLFKHIDIVDNVSKDEKSALESENVLLKEKINKIRDSFECLKRDFKLQESTNDNQEVIINEKNAKINNLENKIKEVKLKDDKKEEEINLLRKELSKVKATVKSKEEHITECVIKEKELIEVIEKKKEELNHQLKKNEVMKNLLNKNDLDHKNIDENKEKPINDKVDNIPVAENPLSCKNCDFVAKNKSGFNKHKKAKHAMDNKISNVSEENSESDNFADMINDFLLSANYLNKSEEVFNCKNCNLSFASKKFLEIHSETTHKLKCEVCEYETGLNENMEEHKSNPGIWHRAKN